MTGEHRISMSLHPEVRSLIDEVTALQRTTLGPPSTSPADISVDRLRRWMPIRRETLGAGPSIRRVRDVSIPTPGGALRARLYEPVSDAPGLWVWFHGGGCVLGSLEDQDPVCRLMAMASVVDVLSVEYRLAPGIRSQRPAMTPPQRRSGLPTLWERGVR